MRAYQSAALTSLPPPSPVTFFFCIAGSTSFVLFCSSIVLCHIFVNGRERSLCRCSSAGGRFGSLLTFGTDAIPFISYGKWASASWERKQRGGVGWGGWLWVTKCVTVGQWERSCLASCWTKYFTYSWHTVHMYLRERAHKKLLGRGGPLNKKFKRDGTSWAFFLGTALGLLLVRAADFWRFTKKLTVTPSTMFHKSVDFISHVHLIKNPENLCQKTWKMTGQTWRVSSPPGEQQYWAEFN